MQATKSTLSVLTSLRAISIILVLLSHNPFYPIPSMVVGVDIFFLISGFLITSILSKPNPKLANFYYHRIRRLLPSLLTTIFFTLLVGKIISAASFNNSLKNYALNSILVKNNFYQISLSHNYFHDYLLSPLSSLWSLSIEMQLYLIFPFIILLLNKVKKLIALKFSMLALTLITLVLTFLYTSERYFQTLPRFADFLLGSTLFLFSQSRYLLKIKPIPIALYLPVMLVIILLQKSNVILYPNLYSYAILVLTSLFLITNLKNYNSHKITNYLGERSYNIYLTYLPVTVFLSLSYPTKNSYPLVVLLLFIFAELLYRLDRYFRTKLIEPKKVLPIVGLILLVNLTLIFSPSQVVKNNQPASRNLQEIKENLYYATNVGFPKQNLDFYQNFNSDPIIFTKENSSSDICVSLNICTIPKDNLYKQTLLYVADSTSRDLILPLSEYAKSEKINFIYYNLSSCEITGLNFDDTQNSKNIDCLKFSSALPNYIKTLNKDPKDLAIVLQQASDPNRKYKGSYYTPSQRNNNFKNFIKSLKPLSEKITVVSEIPFPGKTNQELKVDQNFVFNCLSKVSNTKFCAFERESNKTSTLVALNQNSASTLSVKYLDLTTYLCYEKTCPIFVNNMLTYTDPYHISYLYMDSIKSVLLKEMDLF